MRTFASLFLKFIGLAPALHLSCVVVGFFGFLLCTRPPIANGLATDDPVSMLFVGLSLELFLLGLIALYIRAKDAQLAVRSLPGSPPARKHI